MQQQQRELMEQQQERSILADVFASRAQDVAVGDTMAQNDRLAQQYQMAGKRLMGTSPREALKFLREGDTLVRQNSLTRLETAKGEKLKGEYLASVATGVQDQTGLNELVQTYAKEGRTVPRQYQVWNEATARWLERVAQASIPVAKQQDLMLRTRETELRGQAEQRRQQEEDRKIKLDASRESRLREGLEIKKLSAAGKATSELGLRGEQAVLGEQQILADMDEAGVFKSAPPGLQRQAAQDAHMRAQKLRAASLASGDEEPLSAEAALELARREVLGEFATKEGGWFSRDSATRNRGEGGKPAPSTKPAAPIQISSDEDYAKVPKGARYAAPDGTIRTKR
jgi:hypothetical protein